MLLILIGLRGSGKSTIGRALAAHLHVPFTDLDDLTAQSLGAHSASAALRTHGEPAFRRAEAAALSTALSNTNQVLSLGGGPPTAPRAADLLKQAQATGATIVYLRATAETLRHRLQSTPHDRPSLTGADPAAEAEQILAQRDPLYLTLADKVIATDNHTPPLLLATLLATNPDGLMSRDF